MFWNILWRFLLILGIVLLFFVPSVFIEQSISIETQKKDMDQYVTKKDDSLFGILEIPKIGVKNPVYNFSDDRNQVDLNVTLLEETISQNEEAYYIVLASHSGNGIHAYFRNLDQLSIGDVIFFSYHNQKYQFEFFKKEEVLKRGFVYLENYDFPYLVLITCSKTDENLQEVYYAKLSF